MSEERVRAVVHGAVQGVGFRPFVYRLAMGLGLAGWVSNTSQGVFLEAEGPRSSINQFVLRLETEKPSRAVIQSMEFSFLEPAGYRSFEIRESDDFGTRSVFILPDIGSCADCISEIFDPSNRRHLYPFTNCTNCGPRYSIIEGLPYDRSKTSMRGFAMCRLCQEEYHDPANRRFHAQPNACPSCGPRLSLWDCKGKSMAFGHDALMRSVAAVRDGQILALKGIGGFQLIVDARNEEAVGRLRRRKCREEKPFATLYASVERLRDDCLIDDFEARLLASPEAPIALLRKKSQARIAANVAPGNPNLGAMLPASPLHHLLMRELGVPVVATSGNLSNEPICIHEEEALGRLGNIADIFLVHDRPIVRAVDDSIARVVMGREMLIRRARGYAPLPIHLRSELPNVLAVGSHLKNTIAFSRDQEIFVSQHIGDLEAGETWAAFRRTAEDLQTLYELKPEIVACDLHPDYLSTRHASTLNIESVPVQHHYAHILSCIAENDIDGPVLGVCWDGTGLGTDGTIWGGEFLRVDDGDPPFTRVAHFCRFHLPGGEAAARQPRRAAIGLLWELYGDCLFEAPELETVRKRFSPTELPMIRQILANKINAPITSSAGRLFDAVASILGLRQINSFEGQAAMDLEFAAEGEVEEAYSFTMTGRDECAVDWAPMLLQILEDLRKGLATGRIAAMFHNTLVEAIIAIARRARVPRVVLTGGCFQNIYLLERAVRRLREESFRPYWHQRVPPNDGGVSVGQVLAAAREVRYKETETCCA